MTKMSRLTWFGYLRTKTTEVKVGSGQPRLGWQEPAQRRGSDCGVETLKTGVSGDKECDEQY